jgi:hypothetical protein
MKLKKKWRKHCEPSRKGEKKVDLQHRLQNLQKGWKDKIGGPLIFRRTKISYLKVCRQGTGGSDSGHLAAGTAAAQLN